MQVLVLVTQMGLAILIEPIFLTHFKRFSLRYLLLTSYSYSSIELEVLKYFDASQIFEHETSRFASDIQVFSLCPIFILLSSPKFLIQTM